MNRSAFGALSIPATALAIIGLASVAAATTPPSGYVLQETITLSTALTTEGAAQASTTTLKAGTTYKVRVSGTFTSASGLPCPFADAEFGRFDATGQSPNPPCTGLEDVFGGTTDLGVAINDATLDASKFPNWGSYTTSHQYTVDFVGLGAPISFTYHDVSGFYDDNSGTLTAEIFAPGQSVPTLTEWARILLVSLMVGGGLWLLQRRRRLA